MKKYFARYKSNTFIRHALSWLAAILLAVGAGIGINLSINAVHAQTISSFKNTAVLTAKTVAVNAALNATKSDPKADADADADAEVDADGKPIPKPDPKNPYLNAVKTTAKNAAIMSVMNAGKPGAGKAGITAVKNSAITSAVGAAAAATKSTAKLGDADGKPSALDTAVNSVTTTAKNVAIRSAVNVGKPGAGTAGVAAVKNAAITATMGAAIAATKTSTTSPTKPDAKIDAKPGGKAAQADLNNEAHSDLKPDSNAAAKPHMNADTAASKAEGTAEVKNAVATDAAGSATVKADVVEKAASTDGSNPKAAPDTKLDAKPDTKVDAKVSAQKEVKGGVKKMVVVETGPSLQRRPLLVSGDQVWSYNDSEYDRLLKSEVTRKEFKKYDAAHSKQIQQGLHEIYKDNPDYLKAFDDGRNFLSDDVVGPVTLFWIRRFCIDFKIEPMNNFVAEFVETLLHFSTISKANPDWKTILLSQEFEDWIDMQPIPQRAELYKVRRSGSAPQVISVLKLFGERGKIVSHVVAKEGLTVSFQLNAHDFKLLRSRGKIMQQLSTLDGESYDNKKAFDAAVSAAIKGSTEQPAPILALAEESTRTVVYMLSDPAMKRLEVAGLSDELMTGLAVMLDLEYPDKVSFENALVSKVKIDGKRAGITLVESLSSIVAEAEVVRYDINEETLGIIGGEKSFQAVPATVLKMMAELEGVDYPNAELFGKAVQAKIYRGIGTCSQNISGRNTKVSDEEFKGLQFLMTEKDYLSLFNLRNLKAQCDEAQLVEAKNTVALFYEERVRPALEGQVQIWKEHPLGPKNQFDPNKQISWTGGSCGCVLDQLSGDVYGFYPYWMAGVQSGASKKETSSQQLPFNLLSRIGFYGLSFNDQGNLEQSIDEATLRPDFIEMARKYGTKLDWVIYKNDWSAWSRYDAAKRKVVFERLAANIDGLLRVRLTDTLSKMTPYLSFGAIPAPMQGDGVTLYFDGYPLDERDAATTFNEFIKSLKSKLKVDRHHYSLNILVRQSSIGRGPFTYDNLVKLIDIVNPPDESNPPAEKHAQQLFASHLLVLLEEPTTDSKKILRMNIEQALHGLDRQKLLRRVVPVIEFDGHSWARLEDDIIYFKDNFGGIGFWPLNMAPAAKAKSPEKDAKAKGDSKADEKAAPDTAADEGADAKTSTTIEQLLMSRFLEPDASEVSSVCKIVCPNRWAFRFGLLFSVIVLVLAFIFYFRCCRCRLRMQDKYIYYLVVVILPPIILFVLLLSCDPLFESVANGNWPFILSVMGIVSYMVWNYWYTKSQRDIP